MQLTSQDIKKISVFFSGLPVKKAYLFGTKPIGMQFFTYAEELQKLLKLKVDIVSDQGLSKYVKPFADRDKVLIYER